MNVHRPTSLGCVLALSLAACSDLPRSEPTSVTEAQLSNLVSIRVAGFVEAAGIT